MGALDHHVVGVGGIDEEVDEGEASDGVDRGEIGNGNTDTVAIAGLTELRL